MADLCVLCLYEKLFETVVVFLFCYDAMTTMIVDDLVALLVKAADLQIVCHSGEQLDAKQGKQHCQNSFCKRYRIVIEKVSRTKCGTGRQGGKKFDMFSETGLSTGIELLKVRY